MQKLSGGGCRRWPRALLRGFGLEGGEQGKTKAGWRLLCCCHEAKLRD
jgi:hypothetical protein